MKNPDAADRRVRSLKAYWRVRERLTPGLKHSQTLYEQALASHVSDGCLWLDLGCGRQLLSPWRGELETDLLRRPSLAVGLDPELGALRRHTSLRYRVRGDASSLPFRSESFDLVTANMTLEHLPDPARVLAEIHRILKPDSRFLFHTPNALGYTTLLARLVPQGLKNLIVSLLEGRREEDVFPAYYRVNTRRRIRKLAGQVGLKVQTEQLVLTNAIFVAVLPLAVLELLWMKVLRTEAMKGLRTNIICTLCKPRP